MTRYNCGGPGDGTRPDGNTHWDSCDCRAEALRREGVDAAFDYIVGSLRHKAEEHRVIACGFEGHDPLRELMAAHFKVARVLDDAADGYEDGLRPPGEHLRGQSEGT